MITISILDMLVVLLLIYLSFDYKIYNKKKNKIQSELKAIDGFNYSYIQKL